MDKNKNKENSEIIEANNNWFGSSTQDELLTNDRVITIVRDQLIKVLGLINKYEDLIVVYNNEHNNNNFDFETFKSKRDKIINKINKHSKKFIGYCCNNYINSDKHSDFETYNLEFLKSLNVLSGNTNKEVEKNLTKSKTVKFSLLSGKEISVKNKIVHLTNSKKEKFNLISNTIINTIKLLLISEVFNIYANKTNVGILKVKYIFEKIVLDIYLLILQKEDKGYFEQMVDIIFDGINNKKIKNELNLIFKKSIEKNQDIVTKKISKHLNKLNVIKEDK